MLQARYHPDYPQARVEEHPPEGDDFFRCGFYRDSMMEYVELLGKLPTAHFVWQIGMSPASEGRKQFRVRGSEQRKTTYEMAAEYAPKKTMCCRAPMVRIISPSAISLRMMSGWPMRRFMSLRRRPWPVTA